MILIFHIQRHSLVYKYMPKINQATILNGLDLKSWFVLRDKKHLKYIYLTATNHATQTKCRLSFLYLFFNFCFLMFSKEQLSLGHHVGKDPVIQSNSQVGPIGEMYTWPAMIGSSHWEGKFSKVKIHSHISCTQYLLHTIL